MYAGVPTVVPSAVSSLSSGPPLGRRARPDGTSSPSSLAVDAPDAVDADDVGVRELGHGHRLAVEALGAHVGLVDLDRDVALQLQVARQVHHAHTADAEAADDAIGRAQLGAGHQLVRLL